MQYRLNAADLKIVLAMVHAGTLAAASERLGMDASTVFRPLQRIEHGLGTMLFARSHTGYSAEDLAHAPMEQVKQVESALEAVQPAMYAAPDQMSDTVCITTMDTILVGLIVPALKALQAQHSHLCCGFRVSNESVSLVRHGTDIVARATYRLPQHLVGEHIGSIRVGLYAGYTSGITCADVEVGHTPWVAVDDTIPGHPSMGWHKRHFPKVMPTYFVNSPLITAEMVGMGVGIGVLPLLVAQECRDPVPLRDLRDISQSEL